MTSISFEPLYASPLIVLLASVAIVAVIAIVTPPTEDRRKRRLLMTLRSFAALLLLLAAVRPTLIRTDNIPSPATLIVAVDQSKSMSLPDGSGASRWETQQDVITRLLGGIRSFDEFLEIEVLSYDRQSNVIGQANDLTAIDRLNQKLSELQPDGDATDLGMALAGAINATTAKTLAGVVLLGDGKQTARADASPGTDTNTRRSTGDMMTPTDARYGAQVLDALGVPLWSVPIGPPASDDASRDVAITNLPDSLQLFSGNQFDLSFTVEATGLASIELPISVTWVDEAGNRDQVRTRQLDPRSAQESLAVNLPIEAPAPGVYRLEVSAAAQDGEWVTSNNSQTAFVEVREGGGRILILEGPGRPELAFLRRSLSGFPDLELQVATIRGDQKWPVSLEAALQPGRFDILILGDVDASALGQTQLKLIADRIASGVGLITLGGLSTYDIGGYAEGPLADALPVILDASARRQPARSALSVAERQARLKSQIAGPIKLNRSRQHPIVDLGGSTAKSVWEQLPTLSGANRFVGAKPRSGVQTLLETGDQQPLLVIGTYGKGRVAALAIDETYRWWRIGKSEVHRRFWRQLMLWVMSREEKGGDSVIAELGQRRFEGDTQVEFQARVQSLSERSSPIRLSATVVNGDGDATALDVTEGSGEESRISGTLPDLEPGFYKLVIEADDPTIRGDEVAFQVTETSRELANPMPDLVYLQQLASLTEQHGGASFDPVNLDPLIDTIRTKRRTAETPVIEKSGLGDGPISGWIVFLLFTAAMSTEWWLRRQWQMA
ncbi:VWA domain-containing protein [Roseiconus lacunae]|uniref:VWA domain-containing protein n=1 Tax=Roseiconus lacunae TaxID=2605694 RepID=UPI0011F29FA4|nr:VWA domain-containing protein [Roseiconus lacunae]